ncbi:MAG: C2H2-type zinc finger protein [Candidatus Endonucleobacter bathymodioli]|uniref:C2H2-type zinc finger protein n=1 Tax=Candidatus Endonucleibacter bathymodioli TaxID=539814 RepID=A0AA90SWH2_9GAMM|nr:C2H2-type zinc finger protein [Candidatus Endonucleobacter bathymodioli]
MILLFILNLYTYRLNVSTMVKGVILFYCLLTSLLIKAAPDDNISKNINIDKEEEKWVFMLMPQSVALRRKENTCCIAMVHKTIPLVISANKKITSLLIYLQDNDIEEIPNINDYQSFLLWSTNNLSGVDANNFLCTLNSDKKTYDRALVVIFTINENDNTLDFRIEQIELNSTVHNNDILRNDSGNVLGILNQLFASCKHMRFASKKNSHINNKYCDKTPDTAMSSNNTNDDLCPDISTQLFSLLEYRKDTSGNSDDINHEDDYELPNIKMLLGVLEPDTYSSDVSLFHKDKGAGARAGVGIGIDPENNSGKSPEIQNRKNISPLGVVISGATNELLYKNVNKTHSLGEHENIFASTVSECEKPDDTKYSEKKSTNAPCAATHSKERPHRCSWVGCNMDFAQKSNLKRHYKIHTGEGAFHCLECNKTFIQKNHFIQHMNIHTKEQPACCKTCNKTFFSEDILNKHTLIHTGGRPFKCPCNGCDSAFITKGGLDQHSKTHSGERPFPCPMCNKKLKSKRNLIGHISIHTGDNKFKCHLCSNAYYSNGPLQYHIKSKHKER